MIIFFKFISSCPLLRRCLWNTHMKGFRLVFRAIYALLLVEDGLRCHRRLGLASGSNWNPRHILLDVYSRSLPKHDALQLRCPWQLCRSQWNILLRSFHSLNFDLHVQGVRNFLFRKSRLRLVNLGLRKSSRLRLLWPLGYEMWRVRPWQMDTCRILEGKWMIGLLVSHHLGTLSQRLGLTFQVLECV